MATKIHKFQGKKYLEHIKDGIELKEINDPIDYDVIDALTLIETYQEQKLGSPVFFRKKQSLSTSGMLESGASSFHDTMSMMGIDKMSIQSQESLDVEDDCTEQPSLPHSLMLLYKFTHQLEELKDGIERIEKRNEERLKTINSLLYKTA